MSIGNGLQGLLEVSDEILGSLNPHSNPNGAILDVCILQ